MSTQKSVTTNKSPADEKKRDGEIALSGNYKIPHDLFSFIPHESAELYKIVPLAKRDGVLYIGAINPNNLDARDALNFITISQKLEYRIQKITEEQFSSFIEQYGQENMVMREALEEIEGDQSVVLGIDDDLQKPEDFIHEEAPIIKLVSTILAQAVSREASDVHIEAHDEHSLVRYRLDGVLHEQLKFSRKVHDPLVARIKILSNLRLDERRRPQDGRFSSVIQNNRVDFRIATFPTANGEKVVLRVLDKQKGLRSLGDLGLEEEVYAKILQAIRRPYGLILATGPTGAGKTTTLYALLNVIERKSKNIISLEDPVEYRLEGVNQSNIRPEIGYTFATGLRSALRGDPDQILVGEIRDRETAQLAIQASLTGHVVYSTIHTNTAIGAIARLINFGIDPFLIAPTLSLVVGQRMARRLDGEGKESPVGPSLLTHLEKKFSDLPQRYKSRIPDFTSFREAEPTEANPSGMRGRIGIFEALEFTEEIRAAVLGGVPESDIYTIARKNGFFSMEEDAIIKGLRGTIPFSEVVKISNEGVLDSLGIGEDDEAATPVESPPAAPAS